MQAHRVFGSTATVLVLFATTAGAWSAEVPGFWSALGQGTGPIINAVVVYQDRLIVGGTFTEAGGMPIGYIAAWDGSSWSQLGDGISGPEVRAITVFRGDLVVAGRIEAAGGIPCENLAVWNGSVWSPFPGGGNPQATFNALGVWNDNLYVGGGFTTIGGTLAHSIVAWDGTSWSALGDGIDALVHAFQPADSCLYVGGEFWMAGGQSAHHIASWDGSSWQEVGGGLDGQARALTFFSGDLIVGGFFHNAGGNPAWHVARWDGLVWSALGNGIYDNNGHVLALTVYEDRLVAGGVFANPSRSIAAWNGLEWSGLSGGVDMGVAAEMVVGNQLVAAGNFTEAGGELASSVAAWQSLTSSVEGDQDGREPRLLVTPNPLRNLAAVTLTLDEDGVGRLFVIDAAGRQIKCLREGAFSLGATRMDLHAPPDLPAGTYWIRFVGEPGESTVRVVVIR